MSNNLGFAANSNFCPLGGSCDRSYCLLEHSIDASQQSQLSIAIYRPEPVIIQEDDTEDLDYVGYMAASSTATIVPSYGGSALFHSQANDSTPFSQFFAGFQATQSLYAPEDPMLQVTGGSNASIPAYSSVYTPSYQQSVSYSTDTIAQLTADGPVYPPASVRATIPPLPITNAAHPTPAELCAASFGAFHGPNVIPKEPTTKTMPISYPQSGIFQSTTGDGLDTPRRSPTIVQITEEEPLSSLVPPPATTIKRDELSASVAPRKRDHTTASSSLVGASLASSLPPRKKPTTNTAAGGGEAVPCYVPTPIAELERQKQAERAREQTRAKLVPRNRSPCADDFSMIDRLMLPIDLADDEILNPQKRTALPQAPVTARTKPKSTKQPAKGAAISASTSFSVSSRILAPPKKVPTAASKPLSVATSKIDVTSCSVVPKSDAKPLKSILKSSASKSGTSLGDVAKNKANTTAPLPTLKASETKEFPSFAGSGLSTQKRLKGSGSIFDRPKATTAVETEKKSGGASTTTAKLVDVGAKRDRLGHLNETAKVLADLDKQIADKERALRDMISGGGSKSTAPKPVVKPTLTKRAVWHDKRPEEADMNTISDQFNLDNFLDELDGALDVTNKNTTNDEDVDDSVIFCAKKSDASKKIIEKTAPVSQPVPSMASVIHRTSTTTTTVTLKTTVKAPQRTRPPTAIEQMKNRFVALDAASATTTGSAEPKKGLADYGFSKGESRKARIGVQTFTTSSNSRKLAPLDIYDKKIAYSLRSKYLQKIFDEFKKISTNDDESINMAIREEKAILDKISTTPAYAAAIANSVKRIREAASGNTSVGVSGISHMNMLSGRQAGTFSVGVKGLRSSNGHISEADFYAKISKKYLLTEGQMWENGYPRWSLDTPLSADGTSRVVEIQPHVPISIKHGYVDDSVLTRVCNRCGKEYRLTKEGEYTAADNTCIYHWSKAWKKRINGALDSRYTCCDQDLNVKGCVIGELHVTETKRVSTLSDFAETPRPFGVGDPRSRKVYALDCEMVYSVWGPVLARVSIVDVLDELVLNEIVKPEHRVVDPNTRFSGLTIEQLESAKCTFEEVRERVFELVNRDTILIGHSLESDLKAMRIVHPKVVDTSVVFPHRLGPPKKRALKTIACEVLQKIIQEDVSGHDSKEDASACMKIMLHKIEKMD